MYINCCKIIFVKRIKVCIYIYVLYSIIMLFVYREIKRNEKEEVVLEWG